MDTRWLRLKEMTPDLLMYEIASEFPELQETAALASILHRGDTRSVRGKLPLTHYIEHPYRVTLRIIRWGVIDTNILHAALLHDTFEDHPAEFVEMFGVTADLYISATFGPDVWDLVFAVSNQPGVDYHVHVLDAIDDPRVFIVKLSDWTDNALSLHHLLSVADLVRLEAGTLPAHELPAAQRNRRMQLRHATKYAPLAAPFSARLECSDVRAFFSADGYTAACDSLARGIPRLLALAA